MTRWRGAPWPIYPRVCGGTLRRLYRLTDVQGLSPRVRGNRCRTTAPPFTCRSIPACAGEPRRARWWWPTSGVYPRVCGGTPRVSKAERRAKGLSPRVRGNPDLEIDPLIRPRSIPACAGEPDGGQAVEHDDQVYPRVCGGTRQRLKSVTGDGGLSPRVRGNHHQAEFLPGDPGSIPACAGEPSDGRENGVPLRVYPRVCGGTMRSIDAFAVESGLSPRVRGNRRPEAQGGGADGSIPACAGEPSARRHRRRMLRVYPRVCGGTERAASTAEARVGLSPRVRGNHRVAHDGSGQLGSIPACAGEPFPDRRAALALKVYPRVCGGTLDTLNGQIVRWGLSPRVRGNLIEHPGLDYCPGSIPACAGEPFCSSLIAPMPRVYPRVCGGTAMVFIIPATSHGLSPRVRGNPALDVEHAGGHRSIPACAGEPAP